MTRTAEGTIVKAGLVAIVIGLGVLIQYEVDHDVLLAEKSLALPVSRAKAFQFIINMKMFPKVSRCHACNILLVINISCCHS